MPHETTDATDAPGATVTLNRGPLETPAATDAAPAAPGTDWWFRLHAGLSLAAVLGLAIGTRTVWTTYALTKPWFAVAVTFCYVAMLVAAIVALCARTPKALFRLDLGVLGVAIVLKVINFWPSFTGERAITVDEGLLMEWAGRVVAAGQNPYRMNWTHLDPLLATRLMNGGAVFDFGYPPFGVELAALEHKIFGAGASIAALSCVALIATAVLIYFAAPVPLRPLATLGVLGIGTLTAYAQNAYPAMIALPFLCVAVWRWADTGRDGRLGTFGVVRAVALGLAVATHQLGWFLAVFLLLGILLLRRNTLGWRGAVWVTGRWAALVAGTFVLVNMPFIIAAPRAWLSKVTEPLTQHAVPHGQGIMGISYYVRGGSGALDYYGHATIILLAAMLVAYALYLPRIGPAAVVLPWFLFAVSVRSQDGYFVLTMPLWIMAFVTTTWADFAPAPRVRIPAPRSPSSAPSRLPSLLRAPWVRPVVAGVLFVPVLACIVVAIVVSQPLKMQVAESVAVGRPVKVLTVTVTNQSSRSVTPHFVVSNSVDIGAYWRVTSGPGTLGGHSQAVYTLVPPTGTYKPTDTSFLRAVSDHPQTLSSVHL